MARTLIASSTISRTDSGGLTATACDTVNFNVCNNDGRTFLEVTNTGASPYTLTVHIKRKVDGETPPAKVYTLAAGAVRRLGPWPVEDYSSSLEFDGNNVAVEVLPLRLP